MEGRTDSPVEDVEYVTISRGEDDGPKSAKEEVINDLDAYIGFFEDSPPNTPDVDWEEEMVVAVALGREAAAATPLKSLASHTTQ